MRASTSIRLDSEAKAITIEVLKQYGLSLSDGINLFCKQVALTHSIPFELKVPKERMKIALEELEARKGEKFKSMEDLKKRFTLLKYEIFRTASFKKGFKKLSTKQQDDTLIIIEKLANAEVLEPKHKDHQLIGNYKNCRECHIKPDLLLIYRINENILELTLVEIGSHAELFDKKTIAISIGDLNGVGIEIALKAHAEVAKLCKPLYCINSYMLHQACELLDTTPPTDFEIVEVAGSFNIKEGCVEADAGRYSYDSFLSAIKLCEMKKADAVVTLPIHKEAWSLAGLKYKGHTDLLRDYFKKDAIMMLGCEKLFVALYTEHIPLREVANHIKKEELLRFFLDLNRAISDKQFGVLGLNPHAGDNGVLGDEERAIEAAIEEANKSIGKEAFVGALVPDTAFTPHGRERFSHFVAMYHDQGLAPLKALYFDESINVSLNLPIIRTSVDHGTAFDIAYQGKASTLSYMNAIKSAINFIIY